MNCMIDSKENYWWDPRSKKVKEVYKITLADFLIHHFICSNFWFQITEFMHYKSNYLGLKLDT